MIQKQFEVCGIEMGGMGFVVKQNIAPDPVFIGFFRFRAVVATPAGKMNAIE
jgi:hypothetical protein